VENACQKVRGHGRGNPMNGTQKNKIEQRERLDFLGIDLPRNDEKGNYLARIAGIFYEKLLEPWFETKGFRLLGRPTIYRDREGKKNTYDYALKKNGKYFIAEAKCYLAYYYNKYRHLEVSIDSLEALNEGSGDEESFSFFCNIGTKTRPYKNYRFSYKDSPGDTRRPHGKILIWAKVRKGDVEKIKKKYKFDHVFSVEEAIRDMVKETKSGSKKGEEYSKLVLKYKKWATELFKVLNGNVQNKK
jgi:hypothetical protein